MLFVRIEKGATMLRIGEFARLSQISIKMLRHYDALGVLRPSHIDPESSYHFYEVEQCQIYGELQLASAPERRAALPELLERLAEHEEQHTVMVRFTPCV